jgi:hypothetical protein
VRRKGERVESNRVKIRFGIFAFWHEGGFGRVREKGHRGGIEEWGIEEWGIEEWATYDVLLVNGKQVTVLLLSWKKFLSGVVSAA